MEAAEAIQTWKAAFTRQCILQHFLIDPRPVPSPVADKITVEHPSDDLLERYSMRRLTEAEMVPLEEHLLLCRDCRNRGVLMDCDVAAIREALKLRRDEPED
jgi:hypothetical protein